MGGTGGTVLSGGTAGLGGTARAGERTQIFEVSTLYGAATLAAALDAGQFGARGEARRALLLSNNAAVPETAASLREMTGWARIAARFDVVLDWNDTIYPHHPSDWGPSDRDSPVWERLLRHSWGLGDGPVELILESVHARPAAALASVFANAAITVYADGLMSYGPTRDRLPQDTAIRIRRLLHLDLVPGLRPLLLGEHGVEPEVVPDAAFRAVLDEISGQQERRPDAADVVSPPDGAKGTDGGEAGEAGEGQRPGATSSVAVILGQYLAALEILTPREEEALHERMLRGAAAAGFRAVIFKPHPTAPAQYSKALEKAAADVGVRLTVLDTPMLAETVFDHYRPGLVVGCFSTAMFTAAAYYGLPIARVGTGLLLERITPYQNSNRVPLTIVDALVPDLEAGAAGEVVTERPDAAEAIGPLVRTVGFCMQSKVNPELRAEAEAWLDAELNEHTWRYFKRARLTALALPGGFASGLARQLPGGGRALRIARRVRRATLRNKT
ncbi:polysialyltransferase family glycosyltransferase [Streptomyces sp. DSM 44917]|uniref:Polysialyltransferase family glycosyltransferase n=1 Tax=Streptomyces boetiae TaxID=3075541 RepID=A0ABU2L6F1_9ACTN|nr:polysialyltransferase family glycosyltransferase [Streptomyces sp. DSM 44917]MDT0307139.1 polysialyltransferase family glycosyltransferase [Streptomyces sp. DSM 44917]